MLLVTQCPPSQLKRPSLAAQPVSFYLRHDITNQSPLFAPLASAASLVPPPFIWSSRNTGEAGLVFQGQGSR